MVTMIIIGLMAIIMLVLALICFFDLGYIAKELVLYKIRKSKKVDEQLDLARKIIDNQEKF